MEAEWHSDCARLPCWQDVPMEVASQRYSSLHDVCGLVAGRRVAANVRQRLAAARPPATPLAAASLQVVHAGEASTLATHRAGAPRADSLAAGRAAAADAGGWAWLGAVRAAMGHAAASVVLCELAGTPLVPSTGDCCGLEAPMAPDGPDGARWLSMAPDGPDGARWLSMAPDGSLECSLDALGHWRIRSERARLALLIGCLVAGLYSKAKP